MCYFCRCNVASWQYLLLVQYSAPCPIFCSTQPVTIISVQKDEDVEFFRQKFAGSQSDRLEKAEAEAKIAGQLKTTKISGTCFIFHACCNLQHYF